MVRWRGLSAGGAVEVCVRRASAAHFKGPRRRVGVGRWWRGDEVEREGGAAADDDEDVDEEEAALADAASDAASPLFHAAVSDGPVCTMAM
jgi:hypothetical protein